MTAKFQQRRRWRDLLYTKPAIILWLILVIGLVRSTYLLWQRERLADAERRAVLGQIEAMELRRSQLTADLSLLQSDRGLEERIREQFSVAKEGEKAVNVVLPPPATSTPVITKLPWWQPLLDLFQ